MVYLFYGLEYYLMKKELETILKNEKIEKINQNTYDLENSSLNDILEDASTISLFAPKKAIIVENSYIFTATTNKKLLEQPIPLLQTYLEHPNENTLLFFLINKDTIDSRKKIITYMKKVGIIKEFAPLTDQKSYVENKLKPYKMSKDDISFFLNRVGNQLSIIELELDKLKIYKNETLEITHQDIIDVTCKTVDIDIFNLIDNIVINNKEKALESYTEMIKMGEEPIKIIIMLANQFRIMYQSKQMLKQGYTEKTIASTLAVHPYRIKLALEKGRKFSEDTLLNFLKQLFDLDYKIKSGKIDKNIGLELFILKI